MKFSADLSCIKFNIKNFDLEQTLNCGQCFRWKKTEDGGFAGAALSHPAVMYQNGDEVTVFSSADEKFWRDYLDVDADYEGMIASFSGVEHTA